eukprot:TRINITY_DN9218_c0_g1_i1.p1 TRINITY_DN9218_c0_g1~~TRINITY_DN9218_c0_g1_i1.p1  ORF type:complete len:475 (-),score=97.06 TRINITY_DN9218_c0_g1_i1:118-1542(-)
MKSALILLCLFACLFTAINASLHSIPLTRLPNGLSSSPVSSSQIPRGADSGILVARSPALQRTKRYQINRTTIEMIGSQTEYWADIDIGTPPRTFTAQIDTGSSLFAVPDRSCYLCTATDFYSLQDSTTSQLILCPGNPDCKTICSAKQYCPFDSSYADGSGISGQLVKDKIQWGGLNATVTFGDVLIEVGNFEYYGVDGILGMAFNSEIACNPSCVTPVFDEMVSQNNISNVFSMSMSSFSGLLTLGGIDPTFGNLTWTPMVGPDFYQLNLESMQVDVRTASKSGFGTVIVDSGTSFLIFPNSVYQDIVSLFRDHYCNLPGDPVCGYVSIFTQDVCITAPYDLDLFPSLVFNVQGAAPLVVGPRDYFFEHQQNGVTSYCLGISTTDTNMTILGDSFMRAFGVVFDRENRRLGFTINQLVSNPGEDSFSNIIIGVSATLGVLAIVIIGLAYFWVRKPATGEELLSQGLLQDGQA